MNVAHLRQNAGIRVLIANEDPRDASALESLLRLNRHCDVRITTDLREVHPMHLCWPFEMLFLDMHSANVDGLAVIDQLGQPMRNAELTVVALVEKGAELVRLSSLGSGAIATLQKPLNPQEAAPQIQQAFRLVPMRINSI